MVDDGSSDDTCGVLEPFIGQIIYVYQENQGPSVARNHGLRLAKGEYVVFLDADDKLLPEKVTAQLACFSIDPSLGAIHSGWNLIDRQDNLIGVVEPWHEAVRLDLKNWLRWKPARLGALLFRRSAIDKIGGFDPELWMAEDVDFLLRLALDGCKMDWLCQPTMNYRLHTSLTRDAKAESHFVQAMLDKFFARPDLPRRIRRLEVRIRYDVMVWMAWRLYRAGWNNESSSLLQLAMAISPFSPELTVHNWIEQFCRHAAEDGKEIDSEGLIFFIKNAVISEEIDVGTAELIARWRLDVWREYVQLPAANKVGSSQGIGCPILFRMVFDTLLMSRSIPSTELPSRIWLDAVETGSVSSSKKSEIAAFYLLILIRTALVRQWGSAWQIFKQAAHYYLRNPRAIGSFVLLCIEGLRLVRHNRNIYRSELPIAVVEYDTRDTPSPISVRPGYTRALVLIRQDGRPVGQVTLPIIGGQVSTRGLDNFLINTNPRLLDEPSLDRGIPRATVAVCTRDRPDDLKRCLQALQKLPDDGQEILVVDNAPSNDVTRVLVAKFPNVRYLVESKPGLSIARNRAFEEAKYELVVFVDDDSVPDPNWLRSLLCNFSDPSVYCVTGLTMPLELDTRAQQWFKMFCPFGRGFKRLVFDRRVLSPASAAMTGVGNNMAIRRCVLQELGPFDPKLGAGAPAQAGEETEVFARILSAGHRIVYEPRALSWHRHRRTRKGVRKQFLNYGKGIYAFWVKRLILDFDLTVFMSAMGWFGRKQFPALVRSLVRRPVSLPLDLVLAQLIGCAIGPIAYLAMHFNKKEG